jgi:riboflavin synthase
MFTGIIAEVGTITGIANDSDGRRITIAASGVPNQLKKGDSVAVSGVCLTAVKVAPRSFAADLAEETWERTSFSRAEKGKLVNLELPLRTGDRLGGHMVQGHVDGTGTFLGLQRIPGGEDYWLRIEIPPEMSRYVIYKGSLCIEGISLTVAAVEGTLVTVAIIPHTAEMTNLKSLQPGDPVNLEVDMVAKYIEKMVRPQVAPSSITVERLLDEGF